MNIYVLAIVADPARLEAVQRAALDGHLQTTPFAHLAHTSETWRAGCVFAASHSIHGEQVSIGRYAWATPETFDTFAGLPLLPQVGGRSWAQALAEERDGGRLDLAALGGHYAILRATPDRIEAHTSLTGSEPVYIARRPGLVVLSNRASLARLTAWPDFPLAYDSDALTTMCAAGWMAHERVPFTGVELLAPGSHLVASHQGVRIRRYKHLDPVTAAGEEVGALDGVGLQTAYDELTAELIDATSLLRSFAPQVRISLTGGKDSRLAAALCHAADVPFVAVTAGPPDHPDVVIAGELARLLEVEHETSPPDQRDIDLGELLDRQVLHGEGCSNIYDPCHILREEADVQYVGHAGAAIKAGYDNLTTGPRPPVTDVDTGRKFLDDLALHNGGMLLREEAFIAQRQANRRMAEELLAEVGRLTFHELAYLRLREGRGTGANRQASAYGTFQIAPFLNDRALQLIAQLPLEHKRTQRAACEIMRRVAPQLATHRFADGRWRFEADGPAEFFEPDTWAQREPLTSTAMTTPIQAWRQDYDGVLRQQVVDRLSPSGSLLEEIVDPRKLAEVLARPAPTKLNAIRSIYGALTARHLVDSSWLPRPARRPGSRRRAARALT